MSRDLKLTAKSYLIAGCVLFLIINVQSMAAPREDNNIRIDSYNRLKKKSPDKNYISNKLRLYEHMIKKYELNVTNDIGWEGEDSDEIKEAKQEYQKSILLMDDKDYTGAQKKIDRAINLVAKILQAQRGITKDNTVLVSQYNQTYERVQGFYEALLSISKEKGVDVEVYLNTDKFNRYNIQAKKYREGDELHKAIDVLQSAALMIENALVKIREKETLVHALKFDSIEEEYEYELERNRSHEFLVKYMLAKKNNVIFNKKMIDALIVKNEKTRNNAIKLKVTGHIEEAMGLLGSSTNELVKALRQGGMFIQ